MAGAGGLGTLDTPLTNMFQAQRPMALELPCTAPLNARTRHNLAMNLPMLFTMICQTLPMPWQRSTVHQALDRTVTNVREKMSTKSTKSPGPQGQNPARKRSYTITVHENDRVQTVNGRVTAISLSVDDIVIDSNQQPCVVEYISKAPADIGPDDVSDGGSNTRFPGVRFVRGRRSEAAVIHIILRPLPEPTPREDAAPVFKTRVRKHTAQEEAVQNSLAQGNDEAAPQLNVTFRSRMRAAADVSVNENRPANKVIAAQ